MAMTIQLAARGKNRLRYLVTYDGTSGTGVSASITTTGAATPDVLTDAQGGPLEAIAKAYTDGYGQIPAGALSVGKAQALWESDFTLVSVGQGLAEGAPPTAQLGIATKKGTQPLAVTSDVSAGQAIITAQTAAAAASAGAWYVDVFVPGAVGV